MNIIQKLIESVRDGSLPFRICNRFSKTKYAPITELNTNQLIARRYRDDGWKNLTHEARVAWNHFHSALSAKKPRNVVWVGATAAVAIGDRVALKKDACAGGECGERFRCAGKCG